MATITKDEVREGMELSTLAGAIPPPPVRPGAVLTGAFPDDGDDPLRAWYEAEEALLAGAECAEGCDWPDGPLAAGGCGW